MATEEQRKMSPWQPMKDPRGKAILGKLGEEMGELMSAKERILIQGFMEADPESGKPNSQALWEEIADVLAMIRHAIEYYQLDLNKIEARVVRKHGEKRQWIYELVDQGGVPKWS